MIFLLFAFLIWAIVVLVVSFLVEAAPVLLMIVSTFLRWVHRK